MNFEEKLDKYIETTYLKGNPASLKPIVLKLYEALLAISEGTEGVDRDDHPSCGCIADEAMNEVEKILIPHKEIKEFIDTVGNEPRRNKDNI